MKNVIIIYLLVIMLVISEIAVAKSPRICGNVKHPISNLRKKRVLTFPPKTSLVLTLSLVAAIVTHIPSGWNVAVEIDVLYPLLSPEITNALFLKNLQHRQKREFWDKIENAFYGYNMNGRACLYRSICEAKSLLAPKGKSLVHDLLMAIFSAPLHEERFKEELSETHDDLFEENICERIHDCPVSLVKVLLSINGKI